MKITKEMRQLKKMIEETNNLVFFGGAGVSTESGIPDFRSVDGLYNQQYSYPPEMILSNTFYRKNKKEFYRFYKDKMIYTNAEPNNAHLALAAWEKEGKCKAVITQNIDGLHQKAGSEIVWELHGSTLRNYCEVCGAFYPVEFIASSADVPCCKCGGDIKPDVVLYEEGLDQQIVKNAVDAISKADILVVAGTSLSVYPAAGLLDYYKGSKLILINKTPTIKDGIADVIVQGSVGEIFAFCREGE